jgi:hypothetical protein
MIPPRDVSMTALAERERLSPVFFCRINRSMNGVLVIDVGRTIPSSCRLLGISLLMYKSTISSYVVIRGPIGRATISKKSS